MPAPTYAMVVDGVLRKASTNSVIDQGLFLYAALSSAGRLALLSGPDRDKTDWFLRTNGLTKHVHLIPEDVTISPTQTGRRLQQIRELRRTQANIQFVIEPDPRIARDLFNESIPVMLYLHPVFAQPQFRPGYKSVAQPWEDLIKDVEYSIDTKAENAYDFQDVQ